MGRPKLADEERATELLPVIRVRKKQRESYEDKAKSNGFSLSGWIKHVCDKASKE